MAFNVGTLRPKGVSFSGSTFQLVYERGGKFVISVFTRLNVAEHSFGSLRVCHFPNNGKRKVAAHKLKLGK